jgi:hypothetical protein
MEVENKWKMFHVKTDVDFVPYSAPCWQPNRPARAIASFPVLFEDRSHCRNHIWRDPEIAMNNSLQSETVAAAPTRKSSNGLSPLFLVLLVLGGGYWWWSSQPSFSDDDIKTISANIKKKFEEKREVYVQEVSLVRESSNKLTGFVRLKLLGGDSEFTKDCTVTRDEKSTLWHCR